MNNLKESIIKNTDIDEEFVNDFYETLDTNTFCISLEDSFKWLGYARIDNAKRLLINDKLEFIEDEDYIINKIGSGLQNRKEQILIKPETFKMLAMAAKTIQGNKTRRYYVKIEQEYRNLCKEYSKSIIPFPLKEITKLEIDPSKYYKKNVVYLLHIEDNIYKYGWSGNFIQRCKDHKNKRGWIDFVEVFDCNTVENAKKVELRFKRYLNANKLLNTYVDKNNKTNTEIFRANNNANEYVKIIKEYVDDEIEKSKKEYGDYYEKEKELKELDIKLEEIRSNKSVEDISTNDRVSILEDKLNMILNILNKPKPLLEVDGTTACINEIILENSENKMNKSEDIIEKNIVIKCKKCKKEKLQTEENFRLKNDNTFSVNCIPCLDKDKVRCDKKREERNEYNKKYSEAQKKKIEESIVPLHKCGKCSKVLEINETNFEKNEENNFRKICIPCNIIIDNNRDIINQKHREYCARTNNDKIQYEKHKDKKLEQKRLKYNENTKDFQQKNKEYYEENKDKILEQKKEKYNESKT